MRFLKWLMECSVISQQHVSMPVFTFLYLCVVHRHVKCRLCVHVCLWLHEYICSVVFVCYICAYVCLCMYICVHFYMYFYLYVVLHICVHMYISVLVYLCALGPKCVFICVCVLKVHDGLWKGSHAVAKAN